MVLRLVSLSVLRLVLRLVKVLQLVPTLRLVLRSAMGYWLVMVLAWGEHTRWWCCDIENIARVGDQPGVNGKPYNQ